MSWWETPVRWFGRKETKVGPTKDGRLLRIFTRRIGKKMMVMRVDVQCSNCGEWIEPTDEAIAVKDSMGSTRNEHKECNSGSRVGPERLDGLK